MTAPPPPTPDYEAPAAPARRSLGTWAILLMVWSIGLVFWALYGVALVYLLWKIL
jgi:hypothetical protein